MITKIGLFSLSLISACVLSACGNGQTAHTTSETDTSVRQENQDKTDALAGVFCDGNGLISVPMGAYIGGTQQPICQVQFPENYIMYGSYTESESTYRDYDGAYNVLVGEADANDVWENDVQMSGCTITSTAGDPVTRFEVYVKEGSFDEIIPGDNSFELKGKEYQTVYCESVDTLLDTDLEVYIKISDHCVASVYYEGPLFDEMGAERLAENIYGLFSIMV